MVTYDRKTLLVREWFLQLRLNLWDFEVNTIHKLTDDIAKK